MISSLKNLHSHGFPAPLDPLNAGDAAMVYV